MMGLDPALEWLQATSVAAAIRENEILFPSLESVHVVGLVVVVVPVPTVDLRLTGAAPRDRAVARLRRGVLPSTWAAFALAAVTGTLLFSSNAVNYAGNGYFRGKLVLLGLAG